MTVFGWSSKLGHAANAHYLDADGTTACSKLKRADGSPRLAPFLCEWTERRMHEPLCTLCRRLHPDVCHCGRCTAERAHFDAAVARRLRQRAGGA